MVKVIRVPIRLAPMGGLRNFGVNNAAEKVPHSKGIPST